MLTQLRRAAPAAVGRARSTALREGPVVARCFVQLPRRLCSSEAQPPPPPPKAGKLRTLIRKYGAVAVCVHLSFYAATLASLYNALEHNLLSAGDATDLLQRLGVDRFISLDDMNPKAGNFALAWIMAKFTEPPRLLITAATTPRIAKFVRPFVLRFRGR